MTSKINVVANIGVVALMAVFGLLLIFIKLRALTKEAQLLRNVYLNTIQDKAIFNRKWFYIES